MTLPAFDTVRPRLGALVLACFAAVLLRAQPVSVTGDYDSEGTVVVSDPAYDGPVSLRALLSLDFDHAQGARAHAQVTRVAIVQRDQSLAIRTTRNGRDTEWSAEWTRNGGFEPVKEGVKFLVRAKPPREGLFMFTLSSVNDGAALAVKVQRIESSTSGPTGKDIGTFLFLRASGSN